MKTNNNYGFSNKDKNRGYEDGDPDTDELDDTPTNSDWKDWDDGGFLGRPKGGER